jgi:hypothetical protein
MAAESFFSRWSKHKTEAAPAADDATIEAIPIALDEQSPAAAPEPLPPPTIEEVAELTPQSDYTRFINKGVDEHIQRAALKKLFADPHFNIMDGLDIYIDDYNKFDPIPPEMLALLNHAKGLLDPLSQFEAPLMRLMENPAAQEQVPDGMQAAADEGPADILSASAEPQNSEPPEIIPTPYVPENGTPIQATKSEDDDNI